MTLAPTSEPSDPRHPTDPPVGYMKSSVATSRGRTVLRVENAIQKRRQHLVLKFHVEPANPTVSRCWPAEA